MSIDEAIAHAREVASEQKRRSGACVTNDNECDKFSNCMKCAEEHEQIAEWLEELKANKVTSAEVYQQGYKRGYNKAYNKAIDDFAEKVIQRYHELPTTLGYTEKIVKEIAKQLKAGKNENYNKKES